MPQKSYTLVFFHHPHSTLTHYPVVCNRNNQGRPPWSHRLSASTLQPSSRASESVSLRRVGPCFFSCGPTAYVLESVQRPYRVWSTRYTDSPKQREGSVEGSATPLKVQNQGDVIYDMPTSPLPCMYCFPTVRPCWHAHVESDSSHRHCQRSFHRHAVIRTPTFPVALILIL
jgi:hypothetical protein